MNDMTTHPEPEQWQRLRAGLLDHDPQQRARLQQHLNECAHCQHEWNTWQRVAEAADPGFDTALATLHSRALRGESLGARHRPRPWLPALAAALTLSLGLGLWWGLTAPVEQQVARAEAVPDLYEELDFYLWLANEGNDESHDAANNS